MTTINTNANASTNAAEATMSFKNLAAPTRRMHMLDKPSGMYSHTAKRNLDHQMRYSAKVLEEELAAAGTPHVLQLDLAQHDEMYPADWTLYADGIEVCHGAKEFAQECFYEAADKFLDVCRQAVDAAELPEWSEREYQLLAAARRMSDL